MSKYIEPHIKAVLMDFDDTLVGTIEPKWRQHKYIAKTYYGKTLTDDELATHWGKPLAQYVAIIYSTHDTKTALEYGVKHRHEYPKQLFDGTIPLLQKLKKLGIVTGIVTATTKTNLYLDLELHKIPKDLLDYIQTAEDTPYHKPDKRVFTPTVEWLRRHDIKNSEVLYIGDGLHDMKAAIDAGFNFLGVETGLVKNDKFTKAGANSIPSIDKLL